MKNEKNINEIQEENAIVQLSDKELEKVSGGDDKTPVFYQDPVYYHSVMPD